MSRQIKIFACAAIFSVLLFIGAGAGILYIVGETWTRLQRKARSHDRPTN